MCRWRSGRELDKFEEREKASVKGLKWEGGRSNEVLIRGLPKLDHRDHAEDLELDSKINGKPLNSFKT